MKYILENPTFQEKEIEIDNPKAIENVVVKLILTSRKEEECRFKQVPNKYY